MTYWLKVNKQVHGCIGVCRLGPCMCSGVLDTRHKIIPPGKSEPSISYKGMAYNDPIAVSMINTDTAVFCAEMRAVSEWRQRNEDGSNSD
jgi:hypothetical protein